MSKRNGGLRMALGLLVLVSLVINGRTAHARKSGAENVNVPLSPRIARLLTRLQKGDRSALYKFWEDARKSGTPVVERIPGDNRNVLVTFLWRAKQDTRNVVVFLQTGGLNPSDNQMTRVPGTDLWYRSYVFPKDVRFLYTLSPNDDLTPLNTPNMDWQKRFANVQADPLNPKRYPQASSPTDKNIQSVVELPGASPQPWITKRAGVPAGKVLEQKIKSRILNNERRLWVYLPAQYETRKEPYALVILLDGQSYLDLVPTPTILDNLIAGGGVPPLVAVLVDNPGPAERERELPCDTSFAEFLARELTPWIRERYRVTVDASKTVVAGSSYGGLASTCAGMWYPHIFGNVLSQSASYWWKPEEDSEYEWVKQQFSARPRLPLRFYLTVGRLETMPKPGNTNQVEVNRRLRDALRAKGYDIKYSEFAGAHEYINWQGTLADGLVKLLGGNKR